MGVAVDARLQERAPRNVLEHRERAFRAEADALRLHAVAARGRSEGGGDAVHRAHVAERRAIGLKRKEAASAADAFVCDPVDEERYVTGFFEQHDLEDIGQFGYEELDLAREAEDSEAEERVDTFFVTEIEESPLGRRLRCNAEIADRDAVMLQHDVEQIRVPRLFDTLHRERFANQRVRNFLRELRDHVTGVAFRRESDAPKGNGTQAVDGGSIECGPRQFRGCKAAVRLDEGLTEEGFVGLRAVRHIGQSRDATGNSFSIEAAAVLTALFSVATFVFHIVNAGRYGYQRDELYFLSCAQHLAWGYVDQPPLIAVIAKFAHALFGDSLYAIRLLPAIAAGATVALTGRLTRRLGGGLVAQSLAMLGIALAPFYLAVGNLLTMNAFEPLLWIGSAYLFLRADEDDLPVQWVALGFVTGLGLVNKYSMFFFLGSCVLAIALTSMRRSLRRPGFAVAAALALAIVAPTLVWQAQHGWPQLTVLHNAAADKNVVVGPFAFYVQQVLMMNPLAAPIWFAGLYGLLFTSGGRTLRWYGLAYVFLSAIYLALGAKVYYMAPIYPVLFAAGAALLEARFVSIRWATPAYSLLLLASGLAIAPEAFPLLPLAAFIRYEHVLDFRGIKMERHPEGKVPQHFADQLGWNTLVAKLGAVYAALPPSEQREAVVFTRDYGQASAVDFLGSRYGLPQAISGHNNYFLYGTRGASGNVVIAVGIDAAQLRGQWLDVRAAGVYHDDYVLPDFNNLPIYVCRRPIEAFAAWWPTTKRYI